MKFEKVSREQFEKDYTKIFKEGEQLTFEDKEYLNKIYDSIKIPKRGTKYSAGYDLATPISFKLKPEQRILIPSGIKTELDNDKVFEVVPRSSTGMKGLYICNTLGIIDSDYYNNSKNEGHIMYCVGNRGEEDLSYQEGQNILQGIILKYFTVNEDSVNTIRTGGTGSTD